MKPVYEIKRQDLLRDYSTCLQIKTTFMHFIAFHPNGHKEHEILCDVILATQDTPTETQSAYISYHLSGKQQTKFFMKNSKSVGYYVSYDPSGNISRKTFNGPQANQLDKS